MKNILLIVVAMLIGFLAGFYLKNTNLLDLQKFNPIKLSCEYNEKKYKSGESFKSIDGCNSCSCQNGEVACTLMACLPD